MDSALKMAMRDGRTEFASGLFAHQNERKACTNATHTTPRHH